METQARKRRIIIGMTGSTGAIFGVRFLEALKKTEIETHLIVSKWAQRTIEHAWRLLVVCSTADGILHLTCLGIAR